MSHNVAHRTHEIGIRVALGAQDSDVFNLILGQGAQLALLGIGIGLLAAWPITRLLKKLLYGVSSTDPLTFTGVGLLLLSIALLACYLPARRAAKVDPLVALRHK
jgi:putative ABC transport system permease protein